MGLWVLIGVLVAASVGGLVLRLRSGRVRPSRRAGSPSGESTAELGAEAGSAWSHLGVGPVSAQDRVLLLQLSSPVCTPCRQTASVLFDLVGRTTGLRHIEVDVSDRPDLASTLRVMRTPTVIAFDSSGRELLRVHGVPRVPELLDALEPALR